MILTSRHAAFLLYILHSRWNIAEFIFPSFFSIFQRNFTCLFLRFRRNPIKLCIRKGKYILILIYKFHRKKWISAAIFQHQMWNVEAFCDILYTSSLITQSRWNFFSETWYFKINSIIWTNFSNVSNYSFKLNCQFVELET